MAYSPANGTIFAANNANEPAFASLIATVPPPPSATPLTPQLVTSPITIPGQAAGGGMEQSAWNPNTSSWWVSVPSFNGTDAGGLSQFSLNGTFMSSINFSSMGIGACSASGLALGANGNLMVGCNTGSAQAVVVNPKTGKIVTTLPQISNTDELWYDPTSNRFFVTGTNAAGDRVIDVFDGTNYALLQSIDLTAQGFGTGNAHSVAVDPLNGEIFVPIVGQGTTGSPACPIGCVAEFDLIPEPPSIALLGSSLLLLAGLMWRKRRPESELL